MCCRCVCIFFCAVDISFCAADVFAYLFVLFTYLFVLQVCLHVCLCWFTYFFVLQVGRERIIVSFKVLGYDVGHDFAGA